MLCLLLILWNDKNGFAGTQSSSLNLFSEILGVISLTVKLTFNNINTKWVLKPQPQKNS